MEYKKTFIIMINKELFSFRCDIINKKFLASVRNIWSVIWSTANLLLSKLSELLLKEEYCCVTSIDVETRKMSTKIVDENKEKSRPKSSDHEAARINTNVSRGMAIQDNIHYAVW